MKGAMWILTQATKRGLGRLAGEAAPAAAQSAHIRAKSEPVCFHCDLPRILSSPPGEKFYFYILHFIFSFIKGKIPSLEKCKLQSLYYIFKWKRRYFPSKR